MDRRPSVARLVKDRDVYYTIRWSALKKSDKYDIVRSVPSEAGIYEIYYMDDYGKLCLFHVGKSWYGGLRNEIRLRTDQELENDAHRRSILEEYDSYYRWSLITSSDDMADILFFYRPDLSAGGRDSPRVRALRADLRQGSGLGQDRDDLGCGTPRPERGMQRSGRAAPRSGRPSAQVFCSRSTMA